MFKNVLIAVIAIVVVFGGWWLFTWEEPPVDVNRAVISEETPQANSQEEMVITGQPNASDMLVVLRKDAGVVSIQGEAPLVIDTEKSFFNFTGYAVGKSHEGSFDNMEASVNINADGVANGTILIQSASATTGIGPLDNHLKTADFLDVEKYPEIVFNGSLDAAASEVTGELSFMGQQKTMTFPVTLTDKSLEVDTIVDTSQFGMPSPNANPEVRIQAGLYWN